MARGAVVAIHGEAHEHSRRRITDDGPHVGEYQIRDASNKDRRKQENDGIASIASRFRCAKAFHFGATKEHANDEYSEGGVGNEEHQEKEIEWPQMQLKLDFRHLLQAITMQMSTQSLMLQEVQETIMEQ